MKYINALVLSLVVFTLTACSDSAEKIDFPVLPPELKDCSFYKLENSGGSSMKVVRCPNSSTTSTYPVGKTTQSTVVIDGAEYIRKDY